MKIALSDLETEQVVLADLHQALELNLTEFRDEGGSPMGLDSELIQALITVIAYYTPLSGLAQLRQLQERVAAALDLGV